MAASYDGGDKTLSNTTDVVQQRRGHQSNSYLMRRLFRGVTYLDVLGAFLVPFLAQVIFILVAHWYEGSVPWNSNILSQVMSAAVGFVWVVRALRAYSVVAALVYFPVMIPTLSLFTLAFGINVFREMI